MTSPSVSQSGDPALADSVRVNLSNPSEIIQGPSRVKVVLPNSSLWSLHASDLDEDEFSSSSAHDSSGAHAPPLMSLRSRDWQVLSELFNIDGIEDIEMDILYNLNQLTTTPCWEEDLTSTEELQGFL